MLDEKKQDVDPGARVDVGRRSRLSVAELDLPRFPHLRGDLRGAFASMLVGLPYSLTSGMLAFAPLGPAYLASGMVAGLASSAVAGFAAALAGGTPCQINGPRASVAVLMAGLITAIANNAALAAGAPPGAGEVLGIAMACIALSGLIQVAFGLLRFGAIIRFLPYPVISGFMVALGILVVWPQVPAILGTTPDNPWGSLAGGGGLRWGAIAVGVATIAGFVICRKRFPSLPAPLVGLLLGTAAHYFLHMSFGEGSLGLAGLDTLEGGAMPPAPWSLPVFVPDTATLGVIASLLPIVAAIAFIASLESLLSSSVLGIASQTRADSNRELVAQGVSNIAVAAVGGAVSCGAPFRGVANIASGGRTRMSGVFHSAFAIPLLLFALPVILALPIAALAGVLAVAGWDVASAWRKRLQTCPQSDMVMGLVVMGVTLALGTIPAIAFGVVCATFLYVRNTSRSPFRGHYDGSARLSSRVRNQQQTEYLRGLGPAVRVVEVQGSLFFGTADKLGLGIEELARGSRHLVLDMKRVHEIDPTAALVLAQTAKRVADLGVRFAFASVSSTGRRGRVLTRAGVDKVVPLERWFEDADRALEQTEDAELRSRWPASAAGAEMPLMEMDLCKDLTREEGSALTEYLVRESIAAGATLFREGDAGDRLYLLAKGEITVSVRVGEKAGRTRRLATYGPGVILGEMAVLEGNRRSADAVALTDCVLYRLDTASFDAMQQEAPDLHSHFMLNLSRQLATRLRATTLELRAATG